MAGYTGCQSPGNRVIPSAAAHSLRHLPCRVWSLGAMDSFELNKIMGAILGTCLGILSLNIAANAVFHPEMPKQPGFKIEVPETPKGGEQKAPAEPEQPIEQLLASAEPGRGKSVASQCQACHTFEKGGKNLVGPNLYGVVGRQKGSAPGFNYSPAFKKMVASGDGKWTPHDINEFIKSPKAMVPGTTMTFGGISKANQRADLITYLNTLSDNPQPLGKAAQAK
jgi:cytochrome c